MENGIASFMSKNKISSALLSQCLYLQERHHVSHPCKTTGTSLT